MSRSKHQKPRKNPPNGGTSKRKLRMLAAKLGVAEPFRRGASAEFLTFAVAHSARPPAVITAETEDGQKVAREVLDAAGHALRHANFQLRGSKSSLTLAEFFQTLPLLRAIAGNKFKTDRESEARLRLHARLEEVWHAGCDSICDWLFKPIVEAIGRYSRFDERLLNVDWETGPDRYVLRLTQIPPRERSLTIKGVTRRVFQVGFLGFGFPQGNWLQQSPKAYGLSDSLEPVPVYMQSHALNRFFERMCDSRNTFTWAVIFASLVEPLVVPRSSGGPLIECRFDDCRLGYFVADLTPEGILIRTFLFLTMEGTPEFERIARRLHVKRYGIETMNLDRFGSFVQSDLLHDTELRTLFSEAGLEHLMNFAQSLQKDNGGVRLKLRDHVRRYLGRPSTPTTPKPNGIGQATR